jgi:hypothetical protein
MISNTNDKERSDNIHLQERTSMKVPQAYRLYSQQTKPKELLYAVAGTRGMAPLRNTGLKLRGKTGLG